MALYYQILKLKTGLCLNFHNIYVYHHYFAFTKRQKAIQLPISSKSPVAINSNGWHETENSISDMDHHTDNDLVQSEPEHIMSWRVPILFLLRYKLHLDFFWEYVMLFCKIYFYCFISRSPFARVCRLFYFLPYLI